MRRTHVLPSAVDAVVGKLSSKFHGPCEVVGRRGIICTNSLIAILGVRVPCTL